MKKDFFGFIAQWFHFYVFNAESVNKKQKLLEEKL